MDVTIVFNSDEFELSDDIDEASAPGVYKLAMTSKVVYIINLDFIFGHLLAAVNFIAIVFYYVSFLQMLSFDIYGMDKSVHKFKNSS